MLSLAELGVSGCSEFSICSGWPFILSGVMPTEVKQH
jgi:hypothetical protein